MTFYDFCDGWPESRKNSFSYEGKRALFDYLEEYENSTGQPLEFDPVALDCEFTEYASADEAALNYFQYEGMIFDETMTADEVETSALVFLQDNTTVIIFDGGVIIQDF